MKTEELLQPEEKGIPICCSRCGGRLLYKGLGEYQCEHCQNKERDNYGKVRSYLESHPGALIPDICRDTGLKRSDIARMIAEDKFQISG